MISQRDTPESAHNVKVFTESDNIAIAKPQLQKIPGSRFSEKYLASRYASSASSYGRSSVYPPVPPRSSSSTTTSSFPAPATAPSSPPRKVVSTFAAFSAPIGLSMNDTALGANPAQSADDALAQSVELKLASISLEQAKRVVIASAWRTAAPRM